MNTLAVTYPADYPDRCFQVWYSLGCPSLSVKTLNQFPEFDGHRPIVTTVRRWMEEHDWKRRASALDLKAREIVDQTLVKQKADMLKRHAEAARTIQIKALEHMTGDDGFDSSAAAVRAFFEATELERSSLGLSESISRLSKMTAKELNAHIRELVSRVDDKDVLDTAEVEIEEKEDDENETN